MVYPLGILFGREQEWNFVWERYTSSSDPYVPHCPGQNKSSLTAESVSLFLSSQVLEREKGMRERW